MPTSKSGDDGPPVERSGRPKSSSDMPTAGERKDRPKSSSDLPAAGERKDRPKSSSEPPAAGRRKDRPQSSSDLPAAGKKDRLPSSSKLPAAGERGERPKSSSNIPAAGKKDGLPGDLDIPLSGRFVRPKGRPKPSADGARKDRPQSSSRLPAVGARKDRPQSSSSLPAAGQRDRPPSSSDLPAVGSEEGPQSMADLPPIVPPELKKSKGQLRAVVPKGKMRSEPFRGVWPFDAASVEVFFGRRRDVEKLHAMVAQPAYRVGAMVGEPGVGKTSVLLAGLAPHMKRAGLLPVYMQCSDNIRETVARSFSAAGAREVLPDEELAAYAVRISRNTQAGVVLLIDDVSDILAGEDEKAKRELARFVGQLAGVSDGRVRAVLAIQSDKFHHLMDLARDAGLALPPANVYRLERLTMDACAEVIEQGALTSGIYFEAGLSKLMSQDLAGTGPVLPLDIQVLVSSAIDRKHLTSRRYLRAGGAEVLRAGWVQATCKKAGGSGALGVLSELADRRAYGPGWCDTGELARACGLKPDKADRILAALTTAGLTEAQATGDVTAHRLVQPGLIPLIRQVDGALRHRRTRARLTIRRRVVAGGLLRPWELLATLRSPPRTAEEVKLVRRSRYVLLASVGGLTVLTALAFLWIHLMAGGGYHLGFRGAGGPAAGTVVVKKGRPAYAGASLFSHSPPVGSVLVDTGFGKAALGPGALTKLRSGKLTGDLDSKKSGLPAWFYQVLSLLKPCFRGKALVLMGRTGKGWKLVAGSATDRSALRRALSLVALVGRGEAGEVSIVEKALKSKDADLRVMALEAVFEAARRKPGAYKQVLARAAEDPSPAVHRRLLQAAADLPAETALAMARKSLDRKDAHGLAEAVKLAIKWSHKRPGEAAEILSAGAAGPDTALAARSARHVRKLLSTKTAAAAAGLAARLIKTKNARAQTLLLEWLASVQSRHLPSKKELKARVLALCRASDAKVTQGALKLAIKVAGPEELKKQLAELASTAGKSGIPLRALVARTYGELLKQKKPADLKRLRTMARSPHAQVRTAAVEALGWGPQTYRLTVMNSISDRSARVRAAAVASMGAWSLGNPAKVLAMLNKFSKGGGEAMRAALATAAARMVNSKNQWWIVRGYITPALRRADPAVRKAAVEALASVAHLNPRRALAELSKRKTDGSVKVKVALAAAVAKLKSTLPDEVGKVLLTLAADPSRKVSSKALEALRTLTTRPSLAGGTGAVLAAVLKRSRGGPEVEAALELLATMPASARPTELGAALARALGAARSADLKQQILASAGKLKLGQPALAACKDVSPAVRIAGLRTAAEMKAPQADTALLKGLEDPDSKVQRAALGACAALGVAAHPVLSRALLKLAANPKHPLRLNALELLAGTTFKDKKHTDEVRALVATAAESRYVPDRMTAARAAGRRPAAYKEVLHRLMSDSAVEVRRQATLGKAITLAASKSPGELRRMMDGSLASRRQRFAAALALHLQLDPGSGKAGGAKDELTAARASRHPLTRLLANAALLTTRPSGGRTRLPDLLELVLLF